MQRPASRSALFLALVLVPLALGACSTPRVDLAAWRAHSAAPRPADARGASLANELETLERQRAADELAPARELALHLVAEHPDDARVLFVASRAESDGLLLAADDDKETRNHAAASALDYAQRARERGESSIEAQAQLAWALGTTTHLQAMSARSAHAQRTIEAAHVVLERAPDDATAHATLAVVNLRLATLPWIARVMASNLPESSLDVALEHAERACKSVPSRENALILAKVLTARDESARAARVLEDALSRPPKFPRDHALEDACRAWLDDLD